MNPLLGQSRGDADGQGRRKPTLADTGELVNDTTYSRDRLGNILTQTETNALGQVTGTTVFSPRRSD